MSFDVNEGKLHLLIVLVDTLLWANIQTRRRGACVVCSRNDTGTCSDPGGYCQIEWKGYKAHNRSQRSHNQFWCSLHQFQCSGWSLKDSPVFQCPDPQNGSDCRVALFLFVGWSLIKSQTWNRSRGSGWDASLEVVPFESGEDPTTIFIYCPSVPLFWLTSLVSLVFHLFLRLRLCRIFLLPLGICTFKAIIQIHCYLLWQTGFLAFLLHLV